MHFGICLDRHPLPFYQWLLGTRSPKGSAVNSLCLFRRPLQAGAHQCHPLPAGLTGSPLQAQGPEGGPWGPHSVGQGCNCWARRGGRMESSDSVSLSSLSTLRKILTDRGTWRAAVHGVAKSQTQLSDSATAIWFFSIILHKSLEVLGCVCPLLYPPRL